MNFDRYPVKIGATSMVYEFVSAGQNGEATKVIIFAETNYHNLYNLGFGDKDQFTGKLNDKTITNNGDSMKVLATVASTVYSFTEKFPGAMIFATGSTSARTRLYQMGLSNNLEAITQDFEVYGLIGEDWHTFEKGRHYEAFYVRLKG